VTFTQGDLLEGVDGTFDAIVANPPYVIDRARLALQPEVRDHEPSVALFGGADGLSLVTRLIDAAPSCLRTGGYLIFEFGLGQDVEIEDLLDGAPSLTPVGLRRDLQGIARTAIATRG
jgi:release factor glutamine methyltransferase